MATTNLFASADVQSCRERGHAFRTAWSDKTPMKVSLLCVTCTDASGRSTYVAYGEPRDSFGPFQHTLRHDAVHELEAYEGESYE